MSKSSEEAPPPRRVKKVKPRRSEPLRDERSVGARSDEEVPRGVCAEGEVPRGVCAEGEVPSSVDEGAAMESAGVDELEREPQPDGPAKRDPQNKQGHRGGSLGEVNAKEDDEGSDSEGSDEGSDDEGSDDEGSDDEGSDDEGSDDEGSDDEGSDDEEPDGNPLRWRSLAIAIAGALVPFSLMAKNARWALDVPLGLMGLLIAAWGLFDTLGTFDDPEETVSARGNPAQFWPRFVELAAALLCLVVSLRLAVAGVLPAPIIMAALLTVGATLWSIVAVHRVGEAMGIWPEERMGVFGRCGFWVVATISVIHLPSLGSSSLIDPWETHYGEVAREMLARNDWITLWWAQEELFFSKPVLDFWIQGLSFSLLDLPYGPDRVLAGASQGLLPQPEWAARMPIFVMGLLAVYVLYKGVARVYGRVTGMLAALVLSSMPYWFLIGRQTMTDLPYVAPLAAALGLLLIGFHADPEERVRVYELQVGSRILTLSAYHVLFAFVVLTALPQVLYLLSRNITFYVAGDAAYTLNIHSDYFVTGSGMGNCGLPGNEPCQSHWPFNPWFQPSLGALAWAICGGVLLVVKRGERRVQRLAFIGAWYCVALSALAKGAPGLVIPLFVVVAFVFTTGRYRDLLRMELGALVLLVACVALPWYVQSYMRHGMPFLNRLLFHDMYKRAFVHVHDTNNGVDVSFRYYIWQMGYGLFPWTGLSVAGFAWWLRRDQPRGVSSASQNGVETEPSWDPRAHANILLALWFVSAFSLFTISLTKFHHYVFPAVPPLAVLTAIVLERCLETERWPRGGELIAQLVLTGLGVAGILWGITTLMGGNLVGAGSVPPRAVGWIATGGGVSLLGVAFYRFALRARPSAAFEGDRYQSLALGALGVLATAFVLLVGRDLLVSVPGDTEGQARLFHLFIYNYDRPWPESLQFGPVLWAFVVLAVVLTAATLVRAWRPPAAAALLSLALWWSAWGTNSYFTIGAAHWGQRETVLEYYRLRANADELLVAYQLNWKGENFYTGNRIPAFVSDPRGFKKWVTEQRTKGTKVMFFTTEHKRLERLERALGDVTEFKVVTSESLCNKFALARVVF